MDVITQTILRADAKGEKLTVDKSWNDDWSNFTNEQLNMITAECRMKYAGSSANTQKCITDKTAALQSGDKSTSGNSGTTWGNTLQNSLDLFNQWRDNKNGNSNTEVYVAPPRTGMSTGAKIGIGVAVVAVIGVAIWYFKFKK